MRKKSMKRYMESLINTNKVLAQNLIGVITHILTNKSNTQIQTNKKAIQKLTNIKQLCESIIEG